MGVFAPSAGAVLVRMSNGRLAGVTPHAGVNPASMPGSLARRGLSARPFATPDNGSLTYNGGPVLHGSAPYLVFWDPGHKISATDKALYERYFADVAAATGQATNVFAVGRQYTDSTGFADYKVSYAPSQAITDTRAYPSSGQCTENHGYTESACLYDSQLTAELRRLISADSLPIGTTGNAPIYFVITPPDVNSCESDNTSCADNLFCAYHSSFGSGATTVLYANIPTLPAATSPKLCQADQYGKVQSPNGNPVPDVAIKYISHEFNETITDPLGNAWFDSASGNENGDNCNAYSSPSDPAGGSDANAFLPTLGGSSAAGTLFNQTINGNRYYTQSEWSNGNVNCEMQPTSHRISAAFNAPTVVSPGQSASFNPSASSSAGGYTSTTWSYGDGTGAFSRSAPATVSHSFGAPGIYTVSLTLVDDYGDLSMISRSVKVVGLPNAVITVRTAHPVAGGPAVSLTAAHSTDIGSSISSYRWRFGDGSTASGAAVRHRYRKPGHYKVTLTVTDASGASSTATKPLRVRSASVTGYSVKKGKALETIKLVISGAGTLTIGGRKFKIRRAETFLFNLRPSSAQSTALASHHATTIRLKLKFVPKIGANSRKTITIRLKR